MNGRRKIVGGAVTLLIAGVVVWAIVLFSYRHDIEAALRQGMVSLEEAAGFARDRRYDEARQSLDEAERSFARAKKRLGPVTAAIFRRLGFLPAGRQAVAAVSLMDIGESATRAGRPLLEVAEELLPAGAGVESRVAAGGALSFLDIYKRVRGPLARAGVEIADAAEAFRRIDPESFPDAERERFLAVRERFLRLEETMSLVLAHEHLVGELIGANGPRKYLLLFQNNNEMRATGGFIGTYGILEMKEGAVRRFFIDGIFEPDGQLKENIVPPKPIQKVSAAWSLHDSNWYPDFPKSAEKAIFFFEKTGGPTVDGVVTMTPDVLGRVLAVLGPVELPEYGITVDTTNYLPIIQEQVEEKYDREENRPKKILGDLSAAILDRAFLAHGPETIRHLAGAFVASLNEKHILVYTRDDEIQRLLDTVHWSGRLLDTERDFLAVVHSNINGFKTDGVIEEEIRHRADIAADGTITDTVVITRRHTGGDTPYEWWNKVNADYLRVYVPKGSKLLSVKGATWEFPPEPLDYEALGFRRDADVVMEEAATSIDEASGTRISEDSGRAVFGMWNYVSPKESVTIEIRYTLPFSLDRDKVRGDGERFSVLYQKQAGTRGHRLISEMRPAPGVACGWQSAPDLVPLQGGWRAETDLMTDRFVGCVLRERS